MHHELVVARVPIGERAARFERDRRLPVHLEAACKSDRRRLAAEFDVARCELARDRLVVGPHVEQPRRVGRKRGLGVDHGGQLVVLHHDPVGEILRRGARAAETGGDRLADEADPLVRQGRIGREAKMIEFRPRPQQIHRRQIGEREDRARPLWLADTADPGMRLFATDEGDVLDAGHLDVGQELALPEKVPLVFLAKQRAPDPTFTFRAAHFYPFRSVAPTSPRASRSIV